MPTSFQKMVEWVDMPLATGQKHVNGLVPVAERENLQNQQVHPAVIRALEDAERYGASHVYFRSIPDSDKPPQAQVFLYDCTEGLYHEHALADVHRKLWNYGKVVLFYAIYPEKIDIFSCFQPPALTRHNQLRYKPAEQLVLAAEMLEALEEKRYRFSGRAFDNGSFWENPKNSPLIRRSRTAQATLLEKMREVRRKVRAELGCLNPP
jgi:hypothetical protein